MNFLADEGVDREIVERLRSDGHKVAYVAEMNPGISDDEVLSIANAKREVLVTQDKDFGEIVFRQGSVTHGIVLLRLAGLSAASKAARTSQAIRDHGQEFSGSFTVLSAGTIRIRRS